MNEDGIKRKYLSLSGGRPRLTAALCERFYNNPQGLDPPFDNIYAHCTSGQKYVEAVAKRGDVLVTHGLLPHSHSPNHLHYARVITNPHVNLVEPFNLNREDGDYVRANRSES